MDLLPLMIAIPLGMGFILPLVPKGSTRVANWLAGLATLALVVLALTLTGRSAVYAVGGWPPPLGINLVLDGLSWLMLLTVAVVSFAATVFSARYMDHYTARNRYYGLFMLMVAGMNAAILTGDMFNLYVFIEVAAVASYALVAFGCGQEELEAAFKYGVLGSVASAFILLGVAVVYCLFGTVNMAHLSEKIAAVGAGSSLRTAALFGLTLFVAGFGLKAALVPFHAWLPDAHPSAPAPISAMLSGVLIKAIGVYALIRVLFTVFGISAQVAQALMVLGALSMVVAGFLSIVQWDYKRLLAYSSISQIGYVMLGIGVGAAVLAADGEPWVAGLALVGAIFHLANHAVFKSLMFLTAGAVEYNTGTRDLKAMGGLRQRMPITGATSLIGSMSIAGVPPFNGFFSKLMIILACVAAGRYGYAAWAVLASVTTLVAFMKVQKYAFFGSLRERWRSLRAVPLPMQAAMVLLASLCLAMSALVVPSARRRFLEPARRSLVDRQGYVEKVLGKRALADQEKPIEVVKR